MRLCWAWLGWMVWSGLATGAGAHEATALVEVVGHYDNHIGSGNAASQGALTSALIENGPLLRPGEILAYVPGMVVTQHSGDGKANQYFLRGFNLDHGTDFATTLNGMPINMPTHAHGHGYSDLNFLIPELVQRVDYRKGPYFAQDGDFASAGAADFHYKTQLDKDFTQFTLGQRGYGRAVGAASGELSNGMHYLTAVELMHNNGPWSVPEHLRRGNGVFMLSEGSRANGWTASVMHYTTRWNATDQIPLSMIESGRLGRFDSLDPSDGARAQRSSVSLDRRITDGHVSDQFLLYLIRSDLHLFSNFGYYTDNRTTGDQFMQQEQRQVYGLKTSRQWRFEGPTQWLNTLGFQTRSDGVGVDLASTQNRQIKSWVRLDQVNQNLSSVFGEAQANWTPWLHTSVGTRVDQFAAHVQPSDTSTPAATSAQLWSPKLSVVLGPWHNTEYFFNAGHGFHSNDARGATNANQPTPALVRSKGYELGVKTQSVAGLQSSLALWSLNFDSELVYVGDTGTVKAAAASQRTGLEFNNRWTPNRRWVIDADFAWTRPRYVNTDPNQTHIPNAVEKVALLAATVNDVYRWSLTFQLRYIGPAALAEDNRVRTPSSTLVNIKARTSLDARNTWQVEVFNVLNQRYNDIAYLSHDLKPYASPHPLVLNGDQIQVHPGEPRTLRVTYTHSY